MKRLAKRHGPKPRYGETMVTVSIRLPHGLVDEIDKAAVEHGRTMNVAWSRTDEIRERLQPNQEAKATAVRDDAVLAELRAVRELLARHFAN